MMQSFIIDNVLFHFRMSSSILGDVLVSVMLLDLVVVAWLGLESQSKVVRCQSWGGFGN